MSKLKYIRRVLEHLTSRSQFGKSGRAPKILILGCLGLILLLILPVIVVLILLAIYLIDLITKKTDLSAATNWIKEQLNAFNPFAEVGQWLNSVGDFVTNLGGIIQ